MYNWNMEQIVYKHTNLDKYISFIDKCRKNDYSNTPTHNHHIIPKFMQGTNENCNLITLSYDDHKLAHVILAECFDPKSAEYRGNICAAHFIQNWLEYNDDDLTCKMLHILKTRKVRPESISKMLETKKRNGNWYATEETKLKMSNTRKGTRLGIENPMYGKLVSIDTRNKISSKIGGMNNGMFGKKHTEESLNLMRTKLAGKRMGGKNPKAKKIKHSESLIEFDCIKSAMDYYNESRHIITSKIKSGEFILIN